MADFILQGVRQTRTEALDISGKNVRLSSPPKEPFQQYLAGGGGVGEKNV